MIAKTVLALSLVLLTAPVAIAKQWNPEYITIMVEYLYREHHEVQKELDSLTKQRQATDFRELPELQSLIENKIALCNSIVTLYNTVASRNIAQTNKTGFPLALEPFLCTR